MFYTEFNDLLPPKYSSIDLFPSPLRSDIEATNSWTYNDINNGVYKSGFATTQSAYETAVHPLFASLDRAESHLASQSEKGQGPYYYGKNITEADVRLFTTIVRFDPVYVQHFKCNIKDIRSGYPYLHKWMRNLYWNVEAFGPKTTNFEHIKKHYTKSHKQINQFVSAYGFSPWGVFPSSIFWNVGKLTMEIQSITPVGPIPDILPLDQEVPAAAAAIRSLKR